MILTRQQRAVMEQIAQGKPNKVVAQELALGLSTVKAHASLAFRRLGATNRTGATLAYLRMAQLIDLPLDYAGPLVDIRNRSIKLEDALQRGDWDKAERLQRLQIHDEARLLRWITEKTKRVRDAVI